MSDYHFGGKSCEMGTKRACGPFFSEIRANGEEDGRPVDGFIDLAERVAGMNPGSWIRFGTGSRVGRDSKIIPCDIRSERFGHADDREKLSVGEGDFDAVELAVAPKYVERDAGKG